MSKKMVTLIGTSLSLLTNAVNETVRYLEQYGLDTNIVAVDKDEDDNYFACIVYKCNELDKFFKYSVYELYYSDIMESEPSDYEDFIDPKFGEEDSGILKEEMNRENRERVSKNEAGKVINSLATSTGDSIDLTEDLMNKKGGKWGYIKKSNMSPGKPNMNPRRPGMKWYI